MRFLIILLLLWSSVSFCNIWDKPALKNLILTVAASHGIDPVFMLSQAYAESSLDPKAINKNEKKGGPSRGLFQIQLSTAWRYCKLTRKDLYDPVLSADCAAQIHIANLPR